MSASSPLNDDEEEKEEEEEEKEGTDSFATASSA